MENVDWRMRDCWCYNWSQDPGQYQLLESQSAADWLETDPFYILNMHGIRNRQKGQSCNQRNIYRTLFNIQHFYHWPKNSMNKVQLIKIYSWLFVVSLQTRDSAGWHTGPITDTDNLPDSHNRVHDNYRLWLWLRTSYHGWSWPWLQLIFCYTTVNRLYWLFCMAWAICVLSETMVNY